MKPTSSTFPSESRRRRHRHHPRGFALVISLTLMVLLTVLAVGLLGLSSITLRSSAQGDAMAVARANARLGMMLAMGQLQKHAGPDQRITARADILDKSSANPHLTGVWESWQIKPDAPPSPSEYKSVRKDKFLGWLASDEDGKANADLDFAGKAATHPVTLWGKGSLGSSASAKDFVSASRISFSSKDGGFAWAVMDEGVKARINTPFVETTSSQAMQTAQLGSGVRPNVSSIEHLEKLKRSFFVRGSEDFATIEKGITRLNFGLASDKLSSGTEEPLKALTHDVTSNSIGLFTDVAAGGLKEDFNLLTNGSSLPSGYNGKGVYTSRLNVTGPSDPRWESLHQLAKLYKDTARLTKVGAMPVAKSHVPAGWKAAAGSDPNTGVPGIAQRNPPAGLVLMPSVAKVQVVFSLLTRDIYNYPKVSDTSPKPAQSKDEESNAELHGPWGKNFAGSSYDYLLHLLYTPVVTLHNPYNVALEFTEVKIVFGNVPFALQVFRNGQAQTKEPAPLDTMFYQQSETGGLAKRFGMTLKTNGGTLTAPAVGSSTFRLLPGEVMLFSPYIDPNRTWKDEYSNRTFSDWDTGSGAVRTLTINGLPGWRGDGIGFDLDWFCPSYKGLRNTDKEVDGSVSMDRGGCIGAKASDRFAVKFAPLSVESLSKNKFTVEMFAKPVGSSAQVSSGVIEMDYESPKGLQDSLLGANNTLSYPKDGNTIGTMEMHSHSLTKIKDINTVKPFAIISAQAKTTYGGMNPDGEDGKLGTKPWCFAHAVAGASSQKVISEHPANHSHELSLQDLQNGTNNLLQFDPKTGRGNFVTGLTGNTGLKFGVLYDIPVAPLQSLAQLNAANPGGSSGYLPRFAQPIGNSWAHPLINPSEMITNNTAGKLLDHSFLLNLALYDHFYFSGLADQTGTFGTAGRVTQTIAEEFVGGTPLADPRMIPYAPDGRPQADLKDEATASGAYAKMGAWQVINGPFNINSTSVPAWKAMLGSIHDQKALVNLINKTNKTSALSDLPVTDDSDNEARISRFRLPAGLSEKDGGEPGESYWLGAREYTDDEMERLAEEIVEQVRLRGPFLSMAEFVNRRLGTDETAQKGALQQAIDKSKINEKLAADSSAGYQIAAATVKNYNYRNTEAGTGDSNQGAPGYLSQADLLTVLGNAATPRSDTFTIRASGEARDKDNKVLAVAWCEAVVQRFPEFIDSADKADTVTASLSSKANKSFGRRFEMVSFRWLTREEI
ncbi:hypothetical protein [Luteolibacter soli]|uniref:Type 4 fimbrial biogenesis protein PilX N-terminal domain-containing protein n=1 Tax=Luteolibacter soli TaxID=3135280 RepID=A0ABU9ASQ6_9BACT